VKRRGACNFLVGKREGKKQLESSRSRWEYTIKIDIQEMEWGVWTGMVWLRMGRGGRIL